jgi:hypothetical protein
MERELLAVFNASIKMLTKRKLSEFTLGEKNIIFGVIGVMGGWKPPIKTG